MYVAEVRCMQGFGRERPEGKEQLGRPEPRWEENINIALKEVGWGGMDQTDLVQARAKQREFVNAVMYFRLSYNAGNCLTN